MIGIPLPDGEILDQQVPKSDWLIHQFCGKGTKVSPGDWDQMQRNPAFFDKFFCLHCKLHRPQQEFTWMGTGLTLQQGLQ